jgi:hypothetical protein
MKFLPNNLIRRIVVTVFVLAGVHSMAATPDWLRQAAHSEVASHPDDVAVVLLDHWITTVTSNGEIRTVHRKAFKILRPEGRYLSVVRLAFDSDTQLTYLKGWSLTEDNQEYEVKERDAVETNYSAYALYSDTRYKLLKIPGADPGSVIGYEYQQKEHSSVLQIIWPFQEEVPVKRAQFELELPSGWTYANYWFNSPGVKPQAMGQNRWAWEVTDIAAVEEETQMPTWRSLAGHLGISLTPPSSGISLKTAGDWRGIGLWYWGLASPEREATADIVRKAHELTDKFPAPQDKVRALASYVQNNVRYVAIEIGIGGYQPHAAAEILKNLYGDCKDKATLLGALLQSIGIDSYFILINSDRGFLAPPFPTMLSFDHVILAIRLPEHGDRARFPAALEHPSLGTLLFFDPTDETTPFGYLPADLQANQGLLITKDGGELLKLPLAAPVWNHTGRMAKLRLDESGTLEGSISEILQGPKADAMRDALRTIPSLERQKVFDHHLATLFDNATLLSASINNLDDPGSPLVLEYSLRAYGYGQRTGDLFLFRPCALGRRASALLEGKPRKLPVSISFAASDSDTIDFSFPANFRLDELPKSASYEYPFVSYKSELHTSENSVQCSRTLEFRDVLIPTEKLDDLKSFFRKVGQDENSYVILKESHPTANTPLH